LKIRKLKKNVIDTSSDPKKGALGFFALKNTKFWEKELFFLNVNRKNEAEKISQIWRALKK
jgi:hypothetical protein